jgi:hypothetical protein
LKKHDLEVIQELLVEHEDLLGRKVEEYLSSLTQPEKEQLFNSLNSEGNSLFEMDWDVDEGFSNPIARSQIITKVKQDYIEQDIADFTNYVFNKTGRRLQTIDGKYFFEEEVEKERTPGFSPQFLKEYLHNFKLSTARFFMQTTMAEKYIQDLTKKIPEGAKDKDSELCNLLVEDTLFSFTLNDLLESKHITSKEQNDKIVLYNNNEIFFDLDSLVPKTPLEALSVLM